MCVYVCGGYRAGVSGQNERSGKEEASSACVCLCRDALKYEETGAGLAALFDDVQVVTVPDPGTAARNRIRLAVG